MSTYPNPAFSNPAYPGPAEATAGAAAPNPYTQGSSPVPRSALRTSPGLAFVLGIIPGVGAIYNGQYLKGLVHAISLGLLITLMNSYRNGGAEAVFGMTMAAFFFYMPFEAYHTARKRQLGLPVDEFSSVVPSNVYASRLPLGPIALIAIGVLFLLDTLHLVDFQEMGRYWPVLLIVIGVYMMLYSRFTAPVPPFPPVPPSATVPLPPNSTGSDMMETHHE